MLDIILMQHMLTRFCLTLPCGNSSLFPVRFTHGLNEKKITPGYFVLPYGNADQIWTKQSTNRLIPCPAMPFSYTLQFFLCFLYFSHIFCNKLSTHYCIVCICAFVFCSAGILHYCKQVQFEKKCLFLLFVCLFIGLKINRT